MKQMIEYMFYYICMTPMVALAFIVGCIALLIAFKKK